MGELDRILESLSNSKTQPSKRFWNKPSRDLLRRYCYNLFKLKLIGFKRLNHENLRVITDWVEEVAKARPSHEIKILNHINDNILIPIDSLSRCTLCITQKEAERFGITWLDRAFILNTLLTLITADLAMTFIDNPQGLKAIEASKICFNTLS